MTKKLETSWARFFFCILMISAFPALLIAASASSKDFWLLVAITLPFLFSLYVFFGFGWARVRRANAESPIPVADIGRIFLLLMGPAVPAAIWLGLTCLLPPAIVLAWALN